MPHAALFLITNFEETEAIVTTDILRRGGVTVDLVSLEPPRNVRSKHQITILADTTLDQAPMEDYDIYILPGGTTDYLERPDFLDRLDIHAAARKAIAAICAAPAVLGQRGLLQGKRAVCYPGMEHFLTGATIGSDLVETDGTITTSKGPGTTIPFALRILEILQGTKCADQVATDFLVSTR